MFDRLRSVRGAEDERDRAAAASVAGDPIVDELRLLRTIKDVCSICLEPRKAGDLCWVLKCGHCFHEPCARRWLTGQATCPMCKAVVARSVPENAGAPG